MVLVGRRRRPYGSGTGQPELPLAAPKQRPRVLEPEVAAGVAISRRARPSAIPGHVKLLLTLELRRELAEKLSEWAIREERNIEAIVISLIEARGKAVAMTDDHVYQDSRSRAGARLPGTDDIQEIVDQEPLRIGK